MAIQLSRIRRAIRQQPSPHVRRFLWVALAETVRLTSNSRTSTFKLHIRPPEEIEQRELFPVRVFEEVVHRNLRNLHKHRDLLHQQGLLNKGNYQGTVNIDLGDSARQCARMSEEYDLLVTSPPYGDNGTTVPYGQHSFLPLQWIDHKDIAKRTEDWLLTTHEMDSKSLGGSKTGALEETAELLEISESYRRIANVLKYEPRDRLVRVAAFCRDLDRSLETVLRTLKPNSYMMWTIGNRRVAGQVVPVDEILTELLQAREATSVAKIQRTIPKNSKRMAGRNTVSSTMGDESVIVMRKRNDK